MLMAAGAAAAMYQATSPPLPLIADEDHLRCSHGKSADEDCAVCSGISRLGAQGAADDDYGDGDDSDDVDDFAGDVLPEWSDSEGTTEAFKPPATRRYSTGRGGVRHGAGRPRKQSAFSSGATSEGVGDTLGVTEGLEHETAVAGRLALEGDETPTDWKGGGFPEMA